ncbi:MAG: hypothetical protein AAFQ82_01030 [Myxococcota bacterium]
MRESPNPKHIQSLRDLLAVAHAVWSNPALKALADGVPSEVIPPPDVLEGLLEAREAMRELRERVERVQPQIHAEPLAVVRGAQWFRPPGGNWQSFGRKQTSHRIFAKLVAHHRQEPLSIESLFDAGWGGQSIRSDSMINRVHVALCGIRKRGLRDIVLCSQEGYYLDPLVPVLEVGETSLTTFQRESA